MKFPVIAAFILLVSSPAFAAPTDIEAPLDQIVGAITGRVTQLTMQIKLDQQQIMALQAQVADLQKQLAAKATPVPETPK